MTTTLTTSPESGYDLRWPALFVILAAEIMDLLDALITSIAGPTIVRDLGGGETLIQWLAAGYTVAMASGLLLGGRLGDIFGRKRMFLIGMAGFTIASLLCALSSGPEMLIGFRILQGLIGAVMLPQGLGLIREMFPPTQMAAAFGTFGPIMGLSAVGGPILAGWLVDADLIGMGWRAIFAINIPLGVVAFIAGLRILPASRPDRSLRIDLSSVLLASAGMFLVVYPLIQGREAGWPWWTFTMIAAGLAAWLLLAKVERIRDAAGHTTLIAPSLFQKKAFTGGLATGLALFGALMGFSIVFTLFVQLGLGYSPLKAGLAGVAQAIGMVVGFIVSQPLTTKLGGRFLMRIGLGFTIAGFGLFIGALHYIGDSIGIAGLSPALAVMGIGFGLTMAPFFDIVLAGLEDHESGSASGALTSVQQLGGAIGVAAFGTLFFHTLEAGTAATPIAGFRNAATASAWLTAAMLVVAFALTALLPKRAREDAVGH